MPKPKTRCRVAKTAKKKAPHVLGTKVDFDAIITEALVADPGDVDRHLERIRADAKKQAQGKPQAHVKNAN